MPQTKNAPRSLGLTIAPIALGIGVVTAAPVAAHHGWGGYDSTAPIELTGIIRAVTFENPHGTLQLETPEGPWLVILSPPRRMINRGLEGDMLQVGGTVSIEGYPHKTDPAEMRAERITLNGRTTELR